MEQNRQYYVDIIASMAERTIKKLWVVICIQAVVILAIVGIFFAYLNQYDFADYDYKYEQDGEGVNIIGNGNGVDYNGSNVEGTDQNAH